MKKLTEMTDRELFCTLTGSSNIVLQAQLIEIVSDYKAYCKMHNIPATLTLSEIVSGGWKETE